MPVSNHDILRTILLQELDRMEPETSTFEDDPMQFILRKYAGLKKTLEYLMTPSFEEYITGIYVVAPKPTTFKIVLHNGEYFFLQFMGKAYEATVQGKKYYLMSIGEKERCMVAISRLLRNGNPLKTKGPEGAEQATRDTEGPAEEEGPTPPAETESGQEGEELTESKILEAILREVDDEGVSAQDSEILAASLWNASVRGKLPRELSKYKPVYESLGKYTKKYKVSIEKFSGQNIATSNFWKEETGKDSDEPKTDLISDDNKLRLSAKKGAAQLMSAAKEEAKATVLAAARTAKLSSTAITNLMKLINNFATSTKTDKLNTGELKNADPKKIKSKINIDAKKILDKADKVQKDLQTELNTLFESNPTFKLAFAYEAMTGQEKFSDVRGKANFVIAFNNSFTDVKLEDISKLSSPMVKNIADKCKVSVAFKSSSYKIEGKKAGYRFFSSLRLGLEDLLSKQEKLTEIIETENLTELEIWNKIKQFFSYLYDKFNQLVDYISNGLEKLKELAKEGLDAVLEFLGIDVEVNFENEIDFYSVA